MSCNGDLIVNGIELRARVDFDDAEKRGGTLQLGKDTVLYAMPHRLKLDGDKDLVIVPLGSGSCVKHRFKIY